MEPVQTELRNVFFGFLERTTKEPVCGTKSEICSDDSKSDIRRIVPYVMQVHRGNEEIYIRYAAVVGIKKYERENEKMSNAPILFRLPDQFICLAFDIYFGCLVAFAGYFTVDRSALFTPEGLPVENVHITPMEEVSSQLGMFLMINLQLTNFKEYFASEYDSDIMMLANKFTRLMDREIPSSASFASEIREPPPLIKVPNSFTELPTSQQTDGDETDSSSDNSLVGLCSTSEVLTSTQLGLTDDEDTVPLEGLTIEDQTVVHTAEDLKNRKRVVFHQEHVDIETTDDLIGNIVNCHQIWKLNRSELVSQEDCSDLDLYQTKYYAGIPGGSSGGVVFYKRVFLIGRCLDKFLVIPYNNTDNYEEMKLQTPFGTDILYQRFLGDTANGHDAVTLVDCVEEDEIHIPEFVAPSDVFHILKYWKICTSKEEQIVTRLINRLQAKPESPIPFQSESLGEDVSLNQKRKVSLDHSYARKVKKLDYADELSLNDCSNSTIPLTDNDSIQFSTASNGDGKDMDSNATEEMESFAEGNRSESKASSCNNWNCMIDTTTKRIHKTFLTLGTTETWMLIDQFVPFKEIHIHLKDFMSAKCISPWGTAYLGHTDYFADCPISSSENQNFFLNVLVLGHLQDLFIILPVQMNLLTTKMKLGRPCASHKLYTRKNRDWFMRKLNKDNVDFSIPTTYNIPADQFVQVLKYRHLVTSGASCFQKAIYDRCTSS